MAGPLRATVIGAGNVAWGLAPALEKGAMIRVVRVIARTQQSAEALAAYLGHDTEATTDITLADRDADIVIVAASDDAVDSIASSCRGSDAIWVHTSGSVDASVLAAASPDYGVIYPMQTFTRGVAVDLSDAPVFIEASSPRILDTIRQIALSISSNVRQADSEGRRRLHCAAVFACNFTNHLWTIADDIARTTGASLSDFMPLIDEMIRKAKAIGPRDGQTGPARRGATSVMEAHEALLSPEQKEIYRLLSQSIRSTYE